VNSTGEIAAKLNLSLPLVSYHLKRLEQTGLIKVGYTAFSSKQQKVNRYVPAKFAFVLVPSTVAKDQSYKGILKRALDVLNGKLLVPLVFCSSFIASYIAAKIGINQLYPQSGTGMEISVGSDFVLSFDNFISFLTANPELILAIGVGFMTSYFVWRNYHRKFKTVVHV
jgi:DNA-binding transcriptional ArsR family regulator